MGAHLVINALLADEGFASERLVQGAVFEAVAAAAIDSGALVGRLLLGRRAGASVRWGAVRSAPRLEARQD